MNLIFIYIIFDLFLCLICIDLEYCDYIDVINDYYRWLIDQ